MNYFNFGWLLQLFTIIMSTVNKMVFFLNYSLEKSIAIYIYIYIYIYTFDKVALNKSTKLPYNVLRMIEDYSTGITRF